MWLEEDENSAFTTPGVTFHNTCQSCISFLFSYNCKHEKLSHTNCLIVSDRRMVVWGLIPLERSLSGRRLQHHISCPAWFNSKIGLTLSVPYFRSLMTWCPECYASELYVPSFPCIFHVILLINDQDCFTINFVFRFVMIHGRPRLYRSPTYTYFATL